MLKVIVPWHPGSSGVPGMDYVWKEVSNAEDLAHVSFVNSTYPKNPRSYGSSPVVFLYQVKKASQVPVHLTLVELRPRDEPSHYLTYYAKLEISKVVESGSALSTLLV